MISNVSLHVWRWREWVLEAVPSVGAHVRAACHTPVWDYRGHHLGLHTGAQPHQLNYHTNTAHWEEMNWLLNITQKPKQSMNSDQDHHLVRWV